MPTRVRKVMMRMVRSRILLFGFIGVLGVPGGHGQVMSGLGLGGLLGAPLSGQCVASNGIGFGLLVLGLSRGFFGRNAILRRAIIDFAVHYPTTCRAFGRGGRSRLRVAVG